MSEIEGGKAATESTIKAPSIWAIVASEVREAALSTSIHGLGPFYRAELVIVKIAWIFLFLGSSGYCSYLTFTNIQSYLSYEVVVNIYTQLDSPTDFPKVTICNENPIQTSYGLEQSKSYMDSYGLNEQVLIEDMGDAVMNRNVFLMNVSSSLGNRTAEIGLSLDDMMISCRFAAQECNSSSFLYSFNNFYGNCYSFNAVKDANGNLRQTSSGGSGSGLFMELYVGAPSSTYALSMNAGLHVYVSNQTVLEPGSRGFQLPVGMYSYVEINRVFNNKLPQPYSDCISDQDIKKSDSQLVQLILSTGYDYKYVDCVNMCAEEYVIGKCGCQDGLSIAYFPGVKRCQNDSEIVCLDKYLTEFYSKDITGKCADKCPHECNSIQYIPFISYVDYPSPSYYKHLIQTKAVLENFANDTSNMTYEAVKSRVLSFSINYGDLSYTIIESNSKMGMLDLISQVGGICGLFIGASFMSFFEIVDLVIIVVVKIIYFLSGKKVKPSDEISP